MIATTGVSTALQARNSNFKIVYLDAGFPFWDGFPLLPHLSHNNGKKLDITLVYKESKTKFYSSSTPTLLGYGHSELPLPGETDRPKECAEEGYWKYSLLQKLLPRNENSTLEFDPAFTKALLLEFTKNPLVKRIFIEPHLLDRMQLNHPKIRFQGCHSVRHDDHIHIEVY